MEGPITQLAIYNQNIPYTKADGTATTISLPLFEIPAGTLLFRGVQLPNPKKDEDPRLFVRDWLGYPKGDRFCMTPVQNTFFYTSPYVPFGAHTVGEWFNAIMVYQTVRNLRVVAMIGPSKMTRGGREIKSLDGTAPIQRCNKFDYTCLESKTSIEAKKEKEMKTFDNCIRPEFAKEKQVSGWIAIADYDSLDNIKEGLKGKDTTMGKYIMELESRLPGKGIDLLTSTYTDASQHRGFPEVVLFPWSPHPGTENQYTEAKTEEDAADAIAEMSDRFNYLPMACITERGILEAFTGDFKAGDLPRFATTANPGLVTRRVIDKYQAEYLEKLMTKGVDVPFLGTGRARFDARTGFYVMDFLTDKYVFGLQTKDYKEILMPLETREQREKVLEYKIRYRTFDALKLLKADKLLDGTDLTRYFVFERPDELYKQFKELKLKLPSSFIPYIWSATKTFQLNMADRKNRTDPRGAEEARRKAKEAEAKIQESLEIIAKKKAEREKKTGKVAELPTTVSTTPPLLPSKTPPLEEITPYKPTILVGEQMSIPVINSKEEAIQIGLEALAQPGFIHFPRYRENYRMKDESMPWDMTEQTMRRTLDYIFDKLHYTCYMLCVVMGEPYIFKLEPGSMPPHVKDILKQEIQDKNIQDLNVDNLRVMQCIVKPYGATATTANEWIGFLKRVKGANRDQLPNGIFILNLTDGLMLRKDGNEPFGWFTKGLVQLEKEYYKEYFLPILSYSGHMAYDDVPIPNYDDIFEIPRLENGELNERALFGDNFYESTQYYNKPIYKAVFRGGTTGCGYTPETNARLKLTSPEFLNSLRNKDMLDVGITTITKQYKMDPKNGLGRVDPSTVQVVPPLTFQEQNNYKFIIHIDGNVTAYRLLKTMLTGACILRVMSPYNNWLDDVPGWSLQGFNIDEDMNSGRDIYDMNYIMVKSDLSNLDKVLDFCKEHDDICRSLADRARETARQVLRGLFIEDAFINILQNTKATAISEELDELQRKLEEQEQQQENQNKKGGTRKVSKRKEKKTRKQKQRAKTTKSVDNLELARYQGGGIDDQMEGYIENTMKNVWKTYLSKRLS